MKIHELTLTGRIPSKKNSRNLFVCKGKNPRIMNIPSNKYAEWHAEAKLQVEKQFYALDNIEEIQTEWYMPDNRRCDLTNKVESVLDLLVDCGMIPDDCWQVVPRIYLIARGVDKKNPRVNIWIKTL